MDSTARLALCREAHAQVWAGEAQLRPFGALAGNDTLLLAGTGLPAAYWNGGTILQPPESVFDELVATRAFFEQRNLPYGCLLPVELTDDARGDIDRAGFVPADFTHDLMAVEPAELHSATAPLELEIRPVRTLEEIEDHVAVVAATLGAGIDATEMRLMHSFVDPQVGHADYVHLTGYVNNWPVCAATGTRTERTLGIFGVGTLPGHRGRGYGTAVTDAVGRTDLARQVDLLWLNPSPMAHGVYAGLGFVDLPGWSILQPR